MLYSLITASISSFACPLGGLVSGYLLDRIGRKKTLMLINVLSIVSWALIAVCSTTNFDLMYTQILIARVIIGKWRVISPSRLYFIL